MRSLVRWLLLRPILWLVHRFSSAPDAARIHTALSALKEKSENTPGSKGFILPFDSSKQSFIIFSDQHKGSKNGADDFRNAESNYIAALRYYYKKNFHLIILGDAEELWENTLKQVKKNNMPSFAAESAFALRHSFTKIFGNHDLDWEINPLSSQELKQLYGVNVEVLEAVTLQTTINGTLVNIFCTHGHQGDLQSDGNLFSKFFVSKIWAPLQAYLDINPNTPAYDDDLKTAHNRVMYDWSAHQKNLILITGHTHQPVFASLTYPERLYVRRRKAIEENNTSLVAELDEQLRRRRDKMDRYLEEIVHIKPTYFNTGCCCFADGDITGIEIAEGNIRLIKWESKDQVPGRVLLEEASLESLYENAPATSPR